MRRSTLVHLRKIENLSQSNFQTLYELTKGFGFDEDRGYGFININLDEFYLSTTLVLRKFTYRTIFDPETNTFSRQESTYFEQIPFFIDSKFDTIEVLSNAINTRRVVSIVSELLAYQFAIADIRFSPADVLHKLEQSFTLKKFTINNFVAGLGVSGKYTPEVSDNGGQASMNIIERQKADVAKVTLNLNFDIENDVELTISSNGGLTISCDEDNLIDVLSEIKSLLFEGVE